MKSSKIFDTLHTLLESHEGVNGVKVAAGIEYKGYLVIGLNSYKTHPLQRKFSIPKAYQDIEQIPLHAEIDATIKFLKRFDMNTLSKAKMYLARIKKPTRFSNYEPAYVNPCPGCSKFLQYFPIKELVLYEGLKS